MAHLVQAAMIALAMFGTGAATMTAMNEDVPDLQVPDGPWVASGVLDGRSFEIRGLDVNSGAELDGQFLFRDGGFQSTDCQEYCDFGWSDYRTKEVDGVLHFTATAICPDAPHTVVVHGTVEGDAMVVDATWTTRRWYWTNQIVIRADGTDIPAEVVVSG